MASEEKARTQQRRATTAQWNAEDEILKDGEFGLERVTGDADRIKIGDGTTPWTSLPYLASDDYTTASPGSILTKTAVGLGISAALLADTRIPSQTENDALAGTSGTPSSTNKFVTDQDSRLNSEMPSGTILPFGGVSLPIGYVSCEGQAISRTTYSALFAAIGTVWGSGDGSTTFNVPDLRGRSLIGSGTGPGLTTRSLGASSGAETHQLTEAELPEHTHTTNFNPDSGWADHTSQWNIRWTPPQGSASNTLAVETESVGSDTAHNNMQPYAVVNYMIKT